MFAQSQELDFLFNVFLFNAGAVPLSQEAPYHEAEAMWFIMVFTSELFVLVFCGDGASACR